MVRYTNVKLLNNFVSDELTFEDASKILNGLTEEQIKKAAEGAAKNITSDNLIDAINKDIVELRNAHTTVEKKYQEIYEQFEAVDNLHIGGDPWAPKWKELMLKYTDLVSRSKESAATLSFFAKNHATVTLPYLNNDKNSLDDKIKLINATQEAIKGKQDEAKNFVQEFVSYKTDISKFKVDFENWAQNELDVVNDEIKKAEAHIASLQDQINNYFKLVDGLAIGVGVGAFIGVSALGLAAGVAASGGLAFPIFAITAVIGALAAIGTGAAMGVYLKKIDGLQQELVDEQAKLRDLNAKKNNINQAYSMIKEVDDVLNTFASLITVFSNCWDNIDAELTKLSNELSLYGTIYNTVPEEYNFAVNIWSAFANALDMYITDV